MFSCGAVIIVPSLLTTKLLLIVLVPLLVVANWILVPRAPSVKFSTATTSKYPLEVLANSVVPNPVPATRKIKSSLCAAVGALAVPRALRPVHTAPAPALAAV